MWKAIRKMSLGMGRKVRIMTSHLKQWELTTVGIEPTAVILYANQPQTSITKISRFVFKLLNSLLMVKN